MQHLALLTEDIVATVRALREAGGVAFLDTPREEDREIAGRIGDPGAAPRDLAELGILVDRDEEGLLYQIFTRPIVDRRTLFFEIIERRGARGFGGANIRALFESVERAQAERGEFR